MELWRLALGFAGAFVAGHLGSVLGIVLVVVGLAFAATQSSRPEAV